MVAFLSSYEDVTVELVTTSSKRGDSDFISQGERGEGRSLECDDLRGGFDWTSLLIDDEGEHVESNGVVLTRLAVHEEGFQEREEVVADELIADLPLLFSCVAEFCDDFPAEALWVSASGDVSHEQRFELQTVG